MTFVIFRPVFSQKEECPSQGSEVPVTWPCFHAQAAAIPDERTVAADAADDPTCGDVPRPESPVVLRAYLSPIDSTVKKSEIPRTRLSFTPGARRSPPSPCEPPPGSRVPRQLNQVGIRNRARFMSNVYYTLQVDRCGPGDPGKWRLTATPLVSDGSSVTKQGLYFERLFDSYEEAVQYGSTWASVQRAPVIHAAALHLRSSFRWYGFDVSTYSNDQLSSALLEEAAATTQSSVDLFVRAFQRLRRVEPNRA
jgi:hypothetical protein